MSTHGTIARLGAAAMLVMGMAAGAHAAEEQTIDAFAAWQGRAQVHATGKTSAVAAIALAGQVYAQTSEGPVYAGEIVCPGMLELDLATGTQSGSGHCAIAGREGGRVFAKWTCKGMHLIGCDGEFKLTGGTGRFEGVTGGGPVLVRSGLHEIRVDLQQGTVERTATGIMVWRGLRYAMP